MSIGHRTLPLGTIAGIKLRAHWSVLISAALLTWVAGLTLHAEDRSASALIIWGAAIITALGLLTSLCAHELAHSIVARRNGVQVDQITLWLLGGVSELTAEPDTPETELRIAMAGPTASAVLGGGLLVFIGGLGTAAPVTVIAALTWLAMMNVLLAAFNLLPGAPWTAAGCSAP